MKWERFRPIHVECDDVGVRIITVNIDMLIICAVIAGLITWLW